MSHEEMNEKLALLQKVLNEKLLEACRDGNYRKAEKAIEQGADVNYQETEGYTALHYAATNLYYDIANLLLSKNANIDNKNIYSQTAIDAARKSKEVDNLRMVNFLKQFKGEECPRI